MRGFGTIISFLTLCASIGAQDIVLNGEGGDRNYQIPVDTSYRMILLDDFEMSDSDPAPISYLSIRFPDTLARAVEYRFVCFIHTRYFDHEADDTLSIEAYPQPSADSIFVEMIDFHDQTLQGIRYVNYPGDETSELQIGLDSDATFYNSYGLRFWVKADTLSDWHRFMPLSPGNVWKYTGPAPVYTLSRQEILGGWVVEDSSFYTFVRERQFSEGYGEGIQNDTLTIYSVASDAYAYHVLNGGLYTSFAAPEFSDPYTYQGLFPKRDGSVMWGYEYLGGGDVWKYGVGFALSVGDGFGTISSLIGYAIDGVTVGDVGMLVSIDERAEPLLPRSVALSTFPNPFNASVMINYTLPVDQEGVLQIVDLSGKMVYSSALSKAASGFQSVIWEPDNSISSGVYIVWIESHDLRISRKILLLK